MTERGKQPGNIGELMTMGMCVLALTVVMLNYLQNVQLLQAKENVGQLARAYRDILTGMIKTIIATIRVFS